jgi:hypothetical protein
MRGKSIPFTHLFKEPRKALSAVQQQVSLDISITRKQVHLMQQVSQQKALGQESKSALVNNNP